MAEHSVFFGALCAVQYSCKCIIPPPPPGPPMSQESAISLSHFLRNCHRINAWLSHESGVILLCGFDCTSTVQWSMYFHHTWASMALDMLDLDLY